MHSPYGNISYAAAGPLAKNDFHGVLFQEEKNQVNKGIYFFLLPFSLNNDIISYIYRYIVTKNNQQAVHETMYWIVGLF